MSKQVNVLILSEAMVFNMEERTYKCKIEEVTKFAEA